MAAVIEKIFSLMKTIVAAVEKIFSVANTMVSVTEEIFSATETIVSVMKKMFSVSLTNRFTSLKSETGMSIPVLWPVESFQFY